ncbi:MAG: hypothetical protein WDN44_14630 [Sphingomonas sp.]
MLLAAAGMLPLRAWADDHPTTRVTPDEALAMLREGNRKFVADVPLSFPFGEARRREIAKGQTPFATIVSCSDGRVPPR